jgi:hypothetical protein
MVAPCRGPLEALLLQGKGAWGPRFASFGGRDGLVCLFSRRGKYCHNGDIAFASQHGGYSDRQRLSRDRGPPAASWPPVVVPWKRSFCRGKGLGSAIRVLWGPGWTRLPFLQAREVLPERGPWPSPTNAPAWGSDNAMMAPSCGPLKRPSVGRHPARARDARDLLHLLFRDQTLELNDYGESFAAEKTRSGSTSSSRSSRTRSAGC